MGIHTALTDAFGLQYPIVLAPMNGIAGGLLAAAVSNSGGLGLVGGGYGDADWLRRELTLVREKTDRPWGFGLITWRATPELVDMALAYRPAAVLLSFGDPSPYVPRIQAAGCTLICQVQDVPMAVAAAEAGADVIVAQGTEAGGHGATRATLPLVPAVIDAVAPVPVLAAGGIADGRGVAAALMLGAQGVMMGTRFAATAESLMHEQAKARIVAAQGSATERTDVFDTIRGFTWPQPFTGRALRNHFLERWHSHAEELGASLETETPAYMRAALDGDFDTAVVFAGECVDMIHAVEPAADLLHRIGAETKGHLQRGGAMVDR